MKYDSAGSHEFVGEESLESISYGIDPNNMAMAIEMFTQYSDIKGSIVRELTSNAEDAAREVEDIQTLPFDRLREKPLSCSPTE